MTSAARPDAGGMGFCGSAKSASRYQDGFAKSVVAVKY